MTRYEIAKQISERMDNSLNRTAIEIVLLHLNEMGLIKFETERESLLRETKQYIDTGIYVSIDQDTTAKLVKLLQRFADLNK